MSEKTKRVPISVDEANKILENGYIEKDYSGQRIVIKDEDLEECDDCCFISANMLDGYETGHETCSKCGRVFDVHNKLIKFESTHTSEIIVGVPEGEFLNQK